MSESTVPSTFDAAAFRAQFPLFAQPENSQLVYLDNAATTQKPHCVIDAVTQFYLHDNGNAHRASHRLARAATAMLEQVREQTARWINAASADEIVFCRGATEGLNLLANSLTASLQHGDEIVLSVAEHHANLVPWQMAAQRRDLVLKFLPLADDGLALDQLDSLLTSRTRIVSLTAASNALGFCVDIAKVNATLNRYDPDIVLVVDAAQAIVHGVIDVQQWQCDFLVASAHKFYGPTGVGFIYGKRERWAPLPPWQGGGEMIESVSLHDTVFATPPRRFEAGTASLSSIAGMGAAIAFLTQQSRTAMRRHEIALLQQLHDRLANLPWIELLSQPGRNVGICAFRPVADAGVAAVDVALWLDGHDIAVRTGLHCAQPLVQIRGGAWLRASLAAYNTQADIDRLIEALAGMPRNSSVVSVAAEGAGAMFDDVGDLSLATLESARGWQARYAVLLGWGERIQAKPALRTEANLVAGCEARVWITHQRRGEHHRFCIDSDSRVIRGLAALLLVLIDNCTDAELAALDIAAVMQSLGLARHLSPSRVNGFHALLQRALTLADVVTD